jgi:hypothetical protein
MKRGLSLLPVALLAIAPAFGQSALQVSAVYGSATQTVPSGGAVTVTAANAGQPVLIGFTALYVGASTAIVQTPKLTGTSEMGILSGPSSPVILGPNDSISFTVEYLPATGSAVAGQVSIMYTENNQLSNYQFSVRGSSPNLGLSYFFAPNGSLTSLHVADSITFAATSIGSSATAVINVMNFGAIAGTLQSIGVSGPAFQLSGVPAMPAQIDPGQQLSFRLTFTPQSTGGSQGLLSVNLNGIIAPIGLVGASASQVTYSYSDGTNTTDLLPGGSLMVPDASVGQTTGLTIKALNGGTTAAKISSVWLSGAAALSLKNLPSLPAQLAPGASLTFTVSFSPTAAGSVAATLAINEDGFTVVGNGAQPQALPSYQFQGPSGVQQPAQQPAIGLTLASPYPQALQGALTLSFVSSVFADDPAVQFASGGRTVAFTIPANSTQAVFANGAATMALQTGTTAGNIVITPAFALQNGFSVTPTAPRTLTMTVASAAPQLTSGGITSQTLTSFSLALNGYVTARSMQKLDIVITPKQGASFSTTRLSIDVTSGAAAWFQSAASASYGGAFQVTIPFVLQNGSASDDLVRQIQSLSVTATNQVGASPAISVAIP